jgi:hypothetical protein
MYQMVQRLSAMPFGKNCFIVAALHVQTHNQIVPRAVQIHGHHHLIGATVLEAALLQRISIGGEPYRCPISSY